MEIYVCPLKSPHRHYFLHYRNKIISSIAEESTLSQQSQRICKTHGAQVELLVHLQYEKIAIKPEINTEVTPQMPEHSHLTLAPVTLKTNSMGKCL